MQKWEYLVIYIDDHQTDEEQAQFDTHLDADKFTEKLNNYGRAGWELISFQWTENGGAKAALKRPSQV